MTIRTTEARSPVSWRAAGEPTNPLVGRWFRSSPVVATTLEPANRNRVVQTVADLETPRRSAPSRVVATPRTATRKRPAVEAARSVPTVLPRAGMGCSAVGLSASGAVPMRIGTNALFRLPGDAIVVRIGLDRDAPDPRRPRSVFPRGSRAAASPHADRRSESANPSLSTATRSLLAVMIEVTE